MAAYTAYLLIGGAHQNQDGIIADKMVYLSENGRPAQVLDTPKGGDERGPVWTPTLEDPIEDALLYVSACVLEEEQVLKSLAEHFGEEGKRYVEMYELCSKEERKGLYRLNRERLKEYESLKVVFTILQGSVFRKNIPVLKNYEFDMEVCLSIYERLYSHWKGEVVITGDLDIDKYLR